jgi:lipopolysaccharide export LptBFGC system permease protein LptF
MLSTLHRYILKDLLRTFLMTTAALTVLVTMGGGAAQIIGAQGLDAVAVASVFVMLLPVMATFVMPIAAMFAAAMTFGRMSADNEITACRAAGINIHRLLGGVAAIGLAISAMTYGSWNYMIPEFQQTVEDLTRTNLPRIAVTTLGRNQALSYGDTSIHADEIGELVQDRDDSGQHSLHLVRVAFTKREGTQVATYGTALDAVIIFVQHEGERPRVSADLRGVRTYDAQGGQYAELDSQRIGPIAIPLPTRERLSFLSLPVLRDYERNLTSVPELRRELDIVRQQALVALTLDRIESGLVGATPTATVSADDLHITLKPAAYGRIDKDRLIEMVRVDVLSTTKDAITRYQCEKAIVRVGESKTGMMIEVILKNVREFKDALDPDSDAEPRQLVGLQPVLVPDDIKKQIADLTNDLILDPAVEIPLAEKFARDRLHLINKFDRFAAKISSLIVFRASFAASFFFLVVLAAMLGVIFRGGQVLTAFGVSCIPCLIVVIAIMAGRNQAERPEMHEFGLVMMAGINAVLLIATFYVGTRVLTR